LEYWKRTWEGIEEEKGYEKRQKELRNRKRR
jgi:hypothetical protein